MFRHSRGGDLTVSSYVDRALERAEEAERNETRISKDHRAFAELRAIVGETTAEP